jgi:hypothetical protein
MGLMKNIATERNQRSGSAGRVSFLKSRYVKEVTQDTFDEVSLYQRRAVDHITATDSGFSEEKLALVKRSLKHFTLNISGSEVKGTMRVLKYTRYLDMKQLRGHKRRQFHTYNRIVYGALYVGYIPKLKYGFTEEVKQQMAAKYNVEI